MRMPRPTLRSLLLLAPLLASCDALQPDRTALMGVSTAPRERPRCDACHGYAPRTGAHRFHLDSLLQATSSQLITCASCHAASIATGIRLDTAFRAFDPSDTVDGELMTYHSAAGWPWKPFDPSTLPGILDTTVVDTARAPLYWKPRSGAEEQPQWITRTAGAPGLPGHANGRVDVVFAEGLGYDSVEFLDDTTTITRPYKAVYDQPRLSCNAVACHKFAMDEAHYLWKEPVGKK